MSITPQSIVRTVLDRGPEARRRMHCAGCVMAPFMTLAEAAASHGIEVTELVNDLHGACAAAEGAER